jgi:Putative lumazine-binding
MKRLLLAVTIMTAAAMQGEARNQAAAEREAVRAAVLDYVEALYNAQPERIARSVNPALAKRGYFKKRGETTFSNEPMTYQQLFDLAGRWNKDGKQPVATAPKQIDIYDVLSQTASAKLTAMWGVDYMHLAKYDGRWQIVNVLWQEPPSAGGQ